MPQIEHPIFIWNQIGGLITPAIVDKRWGNEQIYINNDVHDTKQTSTYCMKKIVILAGCETSSHFHINKHETLMVIDGSLLVQYKNGDGSPDQFIHLTPGEAFCIPPGLIHKLIADQELGCIIVEASTPDEPTDSIRVSM